MNPSRNYQPCPKCDNARRNGTRCENCGDEVSRSAWWSPILLIGLATAAGIYSLHPQPRNVDPPAVSDSPAPKPEKPLEIPQAPDPAEQALPAPTSASYETPYGSVTVEWVSPAQGSAEQKPAAPGLFPPPASTPAPGFSPLFRQAPGMAAAPPTVLGVEVKEIGTGKGIDTTWKTDYGSSSKDYYRTKGLQLTVRNVSSFPARDVQAMACWFGKGLKDGAVRIAHADTLSFDVDKVSSIERRVFCPLLFSNVSKFVLLGKTETSGSKFYGWAVLLVKDGEVLSGRGSGAEINEMIRKQQPMETLLAAYQPDGKSSTDTMPKWRKERIGKTPATTE